MSSASILRCRHFIEKCQSSTLWIAAIGVTLVALMSFTYNIGIGITAGRLLFPPGKLVAGRVREVKPGLRLLTGMSLLFFVFCPYP
jgi:xanthine/uracil/vitamin C permease (AzgA family)